MTERTKGRPSHWLRRTAVAVVCVLAGVQVIGWFTSSPQIGHFRSAADRDAYAEAYADALAAMPTPSRTLDIETSFGTVRVYEWLGPDSSGAPVVLLPGRGSGAPMWSENLPEMLKQRTVYALDAIGDAGMSSQTVPITDTTDQAEWINHALTGLGIDRAHIVGHSFGAASAAALALHYPERVVTLTLLEPAFVLGWPSLGTLLWSIPASLPFLPQSWRDTAVAKIAGEDLSALDSDDPVARMITLGGTGYSAELPTPSPLSDEQLQSLGMPVYIALADTSTITQADSLQKAELIPDVTAEVWPNTTHSLPMQVVEPLTEKLAAFWVAGDE